MKSKRKKKIDNGISYNLDFDLTFLTVHNIKKPILRIVVLLIIVGLNWAGISDIGETFAYFNDTENATGNTYQASTLDFSLSSSGNFLPPVTPNQNSGRTINIVNDGSLEFQYDIELDVVSIDSDLCDGLNLAMSLENGTSTPIYSGNLADFDVATSTLAVSAAGTLEVEISLDSKEISRWHKTCDFNITVNAWQSDFTSSGQGFSDTETIHNRVISGNWGVVLNEVLANPDGYDNAPMPGGEWIELYNNDDLDINVNGWVVYDEDGNELYITSENTNTGDTIVSANGWLAVYRNGDSDFDLNNDGDSIRFYDGYPAVSSNLIDEYTYTIPKPEGYSYARIPDGTGNWVDPIPTPGGPNRLEPFGVSDLFAIGRTSGQEEISVDDLVETGLIEIATPALEGTVEIPESILETTTPSTRETIVMEEEPAESPVDNQVSGEEEPVEGTGEEEEIVDEIPIEEEQTGEEEEEIVDEAPTDEVPVDKEQPSDVPDNSPEQNEDSGGNNDDGNDGGDDETDSRDNINE